MKISFAELRILLFLVLSLVFFLFSFTFVDQYIVEQKRIIEKNIAEYNEVDLTHICKLLDCKEISVTESGTISTFGLDRDHILILKNSEEQPQIKILNFMLTGKGIRGYMELKNNVLVVFPISNGVFVALVTTFIFVILFFVFTIMFIRYIKNTISEKIVMNNQKREALDNQISKLVSRNIFHELFTPMVSINYDLETLEEELLTSENIKIKKAVEGIRVNLSLIENITNKTREEKIKKKKKDYMCVYDIIDECFSSIVFQNQIYSYHIDELLKGFYLSDKLSKEDFQNVAINHIKNSFDAGSKNILFKYTESSKGYMTFRLIDDGGGIPKDIQKLVYDLEYSTKKSERGSSGIGLYLCKEILRHAGGDEYIYESNRNGTIFEIMIPVE